MANGGRSLPSRGKHCSLMISLNEVRQTWCLHTPNIGPGAGCCCELDANHIGPHYCQACEAYWMDDWESMMPEEAQLRFPIPDTVPKGPDPAEWGEAARVERGAVTDHYDDEMHYKVLKVMGSRTRRPWLRMLRLFRRK